MKRGVLGLLFLVLLCAEAAAYMEDVSSVVIDVDTYSEIGVVSGSSGYKLRDVALYTTLFPKPTGQQSVERIATQPQSSRNESVLTFKWDRPEGSALPWRVSSQVRVQNMITPVSGAITFPLDPVDQELKQFLRSTQNINSDDPEIIKLASTLVGGKNDAVEAVFEIFSWVRKNIAYNRTTLTESTSQPATWVLHNRIGVCDEMTSLFMALCRSVGIPARYASGAAYTTYHDVNTWEPHSWAELYLPGYGWVPFDVTYSEFLYVDPTHVVLRYSADSNESTTSVRWTGEDVQLRLGKQGLDARLVEAIGKQTAPIDVEIRAMRSRVDFGSYNLLEVRVLNRRSYYVTTELTLATTRGISNIGAQDTMVLLKPNEQQAVYWLVKVDDDLKRSYVYTFPIGVTAGYNLSALSAFESSAGQPLYEQAELEQEREDLQSADERIYSKEIDVECATDNKRIYIDENVSLNCMITNTGNVMLSGLEACAEGVCTSLELGVSRNYSIRFTLQPSRVGEILSVVSVRNSAVSRAFPFTYAVDDLPKAELGGVEYPMNATYDGHYELRFVLNKSSASPLENASVSVSGPFSERFELGVLDNSKGFLLGFDGDALGFGANSVRISTVYYDSRGRRYEADKEIVINLAQVSLFERLLLQLKRFVSSLNEILDKQTSNG